MRKFIEEILKLLGIYVIIAWTWQLLELIITGKINPNGIDTFVAVVLSILISERMSVKS